MKNIFMMLSVVGICVLLMNCTACKNSNDNIEKQTEVIPMEDRKEAAEEKMKNVVEEKRTEENKTKVVDQKMMEVIESSEYDNMSLSEREEMVYGILSKLEQDGYISGLSYDNFLFSFQYADGTLGGWRIKGFEAQEGFLPMN